ncbi:MAG: xanthine phosphoribosyltransferase [Oscillospiraceae bacterium]|nr:xanthine phosphoribosyltransferase [Oscillospiraceae bacterium]
MKLLEQRILADGVVKPGNILKVDSFLNHQLDPQLFYEMAQEIKRLFAGERIDKVLTVEASGIAMAVMTGYALGCKAAFAKKSKSKNISDSVYSSEVVSFTHGNTNTVILSKEYLHPGERVLIVDDFLATGAALIGLRDIVQQAGAELVGAAIAIEKVFQGGGNQLRAEGMRIESLARIAAMSDNSLTFVQD